MAVFHARVPHEPSDSHTVPNNLSVITGVDTIPEGWYRGNTHTHSNQSDGDSPPWEVAARYRDLGYDFLVLSDHNLVVDFSQFSEPGFLCINGEEISDPSNHTNGLGLSDNVTPGTIRENVDAVLSQGAVPHLNHPSMNGLGASDVLSARNIDLLEIFSVRSGNKEEHVWEGVLSAGKRLFGVASDDCHILDSESGGAWIMVRAESLVQDEILDAIAAGDFYATTGVILNDIASDSLGLVIDSQNGERIDFIGKDGRILLSVDDAHGEYLFDGSETYVRARIRNSSGQIAWAQPVFLPAFDIEPYADAVVGSSGVLAGLPENSLGMPYDGKMASNWREHGVGIDTGGYLILDMGEGEEILDRPGFDLYVEEVGPEDGIGTDDPYRVHVSADNAVWHYLGEGVGDSYFDLNGTLEMARYLKIEVLEENVEIDAVEANFIDPYADWVIDDSGVTRGYPQYALGPPTIGPIGDSWENYAIGLETNGHLIVDLGPDEEVVDGVGFDLFVEEIDEEDGPNYTADPFLLHGSMDGVHWTEIGHGDGDAAFDLAGSIPWARYLRLEAVDTGVEIDGFRAENLGANSPVIVTLTPDIDPVVIPPGGGTFGYTAMLENRTEESQQLFAWTMALPPGGRDYGPVLGPVSLNLSAGEILSVHFEQAIPARAPSGQYLFTGYVGSYPAPIRDVDGFSFTKE